MKQVTLIYLCLLCALCSVFELQAATASPITPPFECMFDSEDDLNGWSIFNRDEDDASWAMSTSDIGGTGVGSNASSNWGETSNWLVTPAIQLEKGGRYQLSFNAYIAYYYEEKMRITIGTSPDPEHQTTVIEDLIIPKYDGYYGYKASIMLPDMESSIYYIGMEYYTTSAQTMCVCINNFKLATVSDGNISGKVTNTANQPLAGAEVKLSGVVEQQATTAEDGSFAFNKIPQGEYTLTVNHFGYTEYVQYSTVAPEVTTTCNITMTEMEKTTIVGNVTNKNGEGIAGASIRLHGYADYRTITNDKGQYTLEGVYLTGYSTTYEATIYKNHYKQISKKTYPSGWGENRCDFTLEAKPVRPYEVTIQSTDDASSANISWTYPVDLSELSFDNGEPGESLGFDNSHVDANILGVVYREPMTVYSASWFMTEESRATQVNVNILEVDAKGNATGKVIYTQENVDFTIGGWSTCTFTQPVLCPNGFIVTISSEGHSAIAKDTNSNTVGNKTQLYSNTMNDAEAFVYFEDVNWNGALLIRAQGERYEPTAINPDMTYNVYRLAEANKENPSAWEQIGKAINTTSTVDNEFSTIPAGTYLYAVSATNALAGTESEKTLSQPVSTRCYTRLVVNVSANSVNADAVGAVVTIDNGKGYCYSQTVNENNQAIIDNIWKDAYTLTLKQSGFEAQPTTINLLVEEEYTIEATLKQILAPVTNIEHETDVNGNATILSWDLFADIKDDFEGDCYQDFEMNPAGEIGWQYIDNDMLSTYGFSGSTFPGMGSAMAAVLMNGEATEPPVTTNIAYSGKRELAFFACRAKETEGGLQKFDSDDYLISPELHFHKDFLLTFYARTYQPQNGIYERLRVGYSTTDTQLENFEWITDGYITLPDSYSYYEFSFPKEARYVAVNSSSQDGFILLLDDVSLSTGIKHSGKSPSKGAFNGYNVYVDNNLVTTTTQTEYTLQWDGLSEGNHTVGITKCYASGESEPLELKIKVTPTGIGHIEAQPVSITLLHNNVLSVRGNHNGVEIYSPAGKLVAQAASKETHLDLSHLPKGFYMARATITNEPSVIVKIIIK